MPSIERNLEMSLLVHLRKMFETQYKKTGSVSKSTLGPKRMNKKILVGSYNSNLNFSFEARHVLIE